MNNTFESLGIKLGKGNQHKTFCPQCSHLRNNKSDPCLSVNVSEGIYHCHHCGWSGNIKTRIYELPNPIIPAKLSSGYTPGLIKYFNSRGISEDTLKVMKITEGLEYMPGLKKEAETIQFNYFRDDKLINVKYRAKDKNFKLVKDAELIFYNLDGIKDEEICIITEGEIDCLSYIEAGITYVVSVPNGATKGKNLDYYKNCESYFTNKLKIYLSTDNDEPGLLLRDELARRIGYDRCYFLSYPEGCKDANDVLKRHGKNELHNLIAQAKTLPVNDVIYVKDIWDRLMHEFDNGLSKGLTTYYPLLDEHFTWMKGEVTLLHGIPNHGKSKFLKQLLLIKSLKENIKWAIFTPEEYPPTYFYSDLAHTLVGENISNRYNNQCPKEKYVEALKFVEEHFFYIYPETETATPEYINKKFAELIVREGIGGGVIDPFNQLDNDYSKSDNRDDRYLSNFLMNEKKFALKHDFYKLIVCHPRGQKKNSRGLYDCPDVYELNGGAMWANKCDNIIAFHRPKYKSDPLSTDCEVHIQKIKKQSIVGIPGMVTMDFNRATNRYYETNGYSPFQDRLENYVQQTAF